ncbi:MAG TPA: glycosyltransferase family 39 protein [Vicinamibacterales bacterium]|nr:glycosyltransferase family 39 protein [Vicinamibacterales bacterium]
MGRRAVPFTLICLAALLLVITIVYTSRLGDAPPYLSGDETHFALHGLQLARTGTDLSGRAHPVFFKIFDPLAADDNMHVWYQPYLFYLLAGAFAVEPFNEAAVRLPQALIGVANVALMFLAARRIFRSPMLGLVAAFALAISPAHFLFSRKTGDDFLPVPFVLGWLLFVQRYVDARRPRDLIAAAGILGVGVFTYISCWLLLPALAAATVIAVRPPWRLAVGAAAAFAVPALVLLSLQENVVQVLADLTRRYQVSALTATPIDLYDRITLYWSYFNPSFLFFAGGADLLMATSQAGVFLLPLAPLLVLGLVELVRRRTAVAMLIVIGFLAVPLPVAVLLPEAPQASTGRILPMLVFGVLAAAAGIEMLWRRGTVPARAVVIVLLTANIAGFLLFRADYFGDYQHRAWRRFDPNATRDVMSAVIELDRQSPLPMILLHDDGDNKGIRWRFYTTQRNRADLWARSRYFQIDAFDPATVPAGSVVLMPADDRRDARLLSSGYSKIAVVTAVSGEPATNVFRRDR